MQRAAIFLTLALCIVAAIYPHRVLADFGLSGGGAFLEYPRGRFQENEIPNFFKWTTKRPVKTVTLKVFRANQKGEFNPETDLISRFDFLGGVQSLTWPEEVFSLGNYVWFIEGYNEKNPQPLFSDRASFEIQPLKHFNSRTARLGLLLGFSRGTFKSIDPVNTINFSTTPTTYGILFSGGDENSVWESKGYLSDFVLRGKVYRTANVHLSYALQFLRENPNDIEIFWGPTVRGFQFPRITSPDGINLATSDVTVFMPGLALNFQKQIDQHVIFHSHLGYEIAVAGTQHVKIGLDQSSYSAHFGMLYSLFWPLGFNGEIQYHLDNVSSKKGADEIKMSMDQWAVAAHLIYAF